MTRISGSFVCLIACVASASAQPSPTTTTPDPPPTTPATPATPAAPAAPPARPATPPTTPVTPPTTTPTTPATPSPPPTTPATPPSTPATPPTTPVSPPTTPATPPSTPTTPPTTPVSPPTTPATPPSTPTITTEEDAPPKLSLPSEADREAWTRPGFRLELGLAYGEFHGLRGAPSGRLLGPKLRAGLRLDRDWSLITSFEYTSAKRRNGLAGLRFAGTIDPTWHVTRELSLAVGFGFGGIVEGSSTRMDAMPLADSLDTTYTFPDASHPVSSCSGVGAAGLVRGEYGYVIGPRSTFHVALEAIGQWTLCTEDHGRVEPDTGRPIERRQYWPHVGGTLTLGIMWR